jgi:diketogulonate reductase-like aldo/keto reductase
MNFLLQIKPAVNQVEIHPFNAQESLVAYCKEQNIVITGFSPLGANSYVWLDAEVQKSVLKVLQSTLLDVS